MTRILRRTLLGLLLLAGVALAAVLIWRDTLVNRLVQSQAVPRMSGAMFTELPDGLHVRLCGAGSPMPDPRRAGPCTLVIAGDRVFVVDIGSGAAGNIGMMGVPYAALEAVLLTHFHSDHIDGLGELLMQRWAAGQHAAPMPVIGPIGVGEVVAGFNQAYRQDFGYRVAHHGADVMRPSGAGGVAQPFAPPAANSDRIILDEAGLRITAFQVEHPPIEPAVGYRFDYAGRSVVISGDTAPSRNLERVAQGADLLIHEALSPDVLKVMRAAAVGAGNAQLVQIFDDIPDYHTTPVQAAQSASTAGVRHLLYHHIVPALPARPLERIFMRDADRHFAGPITLGEDGTAIDMPRGSTDIRVFNALP
ncbi:MAG: MBL fold metallo-hydrolase [Oceanococcaceae bacterium]